jgi:hypothetical protein
MEKWKKAVTGAIAALAIGGFSAAAEAGHGGHFSGGHFGGGHFGGGHFNGRFGGGNFGGGHYAHNFGGGGGRWHGGHGWHGRGWRGGYYGYGWGPGVYWGPYYDDYAYDSGYLCEDYWYRRRHPYCYY